MLIIGQINALHVLPQQQKKDINWSKQNKHCYSDGKQFNN